LHNSGLTCNLACALLLIAAVVLCVHVTSGEVDMDVAATLASLRNAHSSSPRMSEHERKLLKIRYVCIFCGRDAFYMLLQNFEFLLVTQDFMFCLITVQFYICKVSKLSYCLLGLQYFL